MMRFLPRILTAFITVSVMSSNCWAENRVENACSSETFEYAGSRLREYIGDVSRSSQFSVKQDIVLGTSRAMRMEQQFIPDTEDPENSGKVVTVWRFSVFNQKGTAEADELISDPQNYLSPVITKAAPAKDLSDNGLAHSGDTQKITTKGKESDEAPDHNAIPLGDGEYLQTGSPLARLGLSQLAILLTRIQSNNPEAGGLVLYASHNPRGMIDKGGKTTSVLSVQLCQTNNFNGEIINCSSPSSEPLSGDHPALFTAQYEKTVSLLLKARLKGTQELENSISGGVLCKTQGWFCSGSGKTDAEKQKVARFKDIFAVIGRIAKTQALSDKLSIQLGQQEVIQENEYELSLSREGLAKDVSGNKAALTLNLQQKPRGWNTEQYPLIKIKITRLSGSYTETLFSSPGYHFTLKATPAEYLQRACSNNLSDSANEQSTTEDLLAKILKLEQEIDALNEHNEKLEQRNQQLEKRSREYVQRYIDERDTLLREKLKYNDEVTDLKIKKIHQNAEASEQKRNIDKLEAQFTKLTDRAINLDNDNREIEQVNRKLIDQVRGLEIYRVFNSVGNAVCTHIQPGSQYGLIWARCAYTTDKYKSWKDLSWNNYIHRVGMCNMPTQGLKLAYNSRVEQDILECKHGKNQNTRS